MKRENKIKSTVNDLDSICTEGRGVESGDYPVAS